MSPTLLLLCVMIAIKMATGFELHELPKSSFIFSQGLYQSLAISQPNVVYSPYSIQAALGILLMGAEEQTSEEILQVAFPGVQFPDSIHSEFQELLYQWAGVNQVELDNASALFVSPSFSLQPQFVDDAKTFYSAQVSNFNLSAPGGAEAQINDFVTRITRGVIKNLVAEGSIGPLTRLVIVNAVFFNGTWEQQFGTEVTNKADFYTLDRGTVQVDTMHSDRISRVKRGVHGADVLELPFVGSRFALYIALPRAVRGITDLENRLNTPGAVNELFEGFDDEYLQLALPKFKIESSFDLKGALQQLGIRSAFSEEANLQGISEEPGLFVSDAIHKAVIEVTESGTVAAAATAIYVGFKSGPTSQFIADHPFMFFLGDRETNIVLFHGKYSG